MKLSQGNVTILETCPRLFQHQVLEQLGVPQLGEQWERLQLGSQFHQLMQQRAQDLPIEPIVAGDPDLSCWFRAVEDYAGELFPIGDLGVWTDCEHVRTVEWMGHTVVGIYDYLALYPESAQILDWKTYPKPMNPQEIVGSWQSRLYPFLLAQTSDYAPEDIEMRYWFFQGRDRFETPTQTDRPQMLRLPYSAEQRDQTAQDLTLILTKLNQWLAAYERLEVPFPQTEVRSTCETCAFAVRCGRVVEELDEKRSALVWDEVGEVAI
jgi:PD-(D/E)XK nuclease superfamily